MTKAGNYETEMKVIQIMKASKMPTTIADIERALPTTYNTASKILQIMLKRGLVKILRTPKLDYYVLPDWQPILLDWEQFMKEKMKVKTDDAGFNR